jgi:hypothetical protein
VPGSHRTRRVHGTRRPALQLLAFGPIEPAAPERSTAPPCRIRWRSRPPGSATHVPATASERTKSRSERGLRYPARCSVEHPRPVQAMPQHATGRARCGAVKCFFAVCSAGDAKKGPNALGEDLRRGRRRAPSSARGQVEPRGRASNAGQSRPIRRGPEISSTPGSPRAHLEPNAVEGVNAPAPTAASPRPGASPIRASTSSTARTPAMAVKR